MDLDCPNSFVCPNKSFSPNNSVCPNTPGPWLVQISMVRFSFVSFSKNSQNIQPIQFSLHVDLVHADFCLT